MSLPATTLSNISALLLKYTPQPIHSLLLYLRIQTHVHNTTHQTPLSNFPPLTNICESLNALHIYTSEAQQTGTANRAIESTHFCAHRSKNFRQCLIYDSSDVNARLIGIEYMLPRERYERLDVEEKKLWHSHEWEVKSGMLICVRPESHRGTCGSDSGEQGENGDGVVSVSDESGAKAWEGLETEALREVVNWYGKTFHTWQVDLDDEIPMGYPELMGSLTGPEQLDVDEVLKGRNERYAVDHREKAKVREGIELSGIAEGADSWWEEARRKKIGVYAGNEEK